MLVRSGGNFISFPEWAHAELWNDHLSTTWMGLVFFLNASIEKHTTISSKPKFYKHTKYLQTQFCPSKFSKHVNAWISTIISGKRKIWKWPASNGYIASYNGWVFKHRVYWKIQLSQNVPHTIQYLAGRTKLWTASADRPPKGLFCNGWYSSPFWYGRTIQYPHL